MFGQFEATLWPSSIVMIGLNENSTASTILFAYAFAFIANALLYSLIGLLIWPLLRFFFCQWAKPTRRF